MANTNPAFGVPCRQSVEASPKPFRYGRSAVRSDAAELLVRFGIMFVMTMVSGHHETQSHAGAAPIRHLEGLDVLRGGAALLVVFGHARLSLAAAQGGIGTSVITELVPGSTALAEEAVAVFFVLSGFLVGGQVIRRTRVGLFAWPNYLINRLSRLWSVLIPGLALTALVDWWLRTQKHEVLSAIFGREINDGPLSLMCNAFFLQKVKCGHAYGSNMSLWSLACEFWYYILFACVAVAISGIARRTWSMSVFVSFAVIPIAVWVLGRNGLTLMVPWLMGAALGAARTPHVARATRTRLSLILLIGGLVICATALGSGGGTAQTLRYIAIGVATLPLVWSIAGGGQLPGTSLIGRVGPWSYSLYVFHAPIVIAIASLTPPIDGHFEIAVIAYLSAATATSCSYALYRLTEAHTNRLRVGVTRILLCSQ